jgi:hypothetical protein
MDIQLRASTPTSMATSTEPRLEIPTQQTEQLVASQAERKPATLHIGTMEKIPLHMSTPA